MEYATKLCTIIVYNLDKNKHLIKSEVNVSQIYELVHNIKDIHNKFKAMLNRTHDLNDKMNHIRPLKIEKQLALAVYRLCNDYKRFTLYVEVYKQLT